MSSLQLARNPLLKPEPFSPLQASTKGRSRGPIARRAQVSQPLLREPTTALLESGFQLPGEACNGRMRLPLGCERLIEPRWPVIGWKRFEADRR